jgi:hypothetical protein
MISNRCSAALICGFGASTFDLPTTFSISRAAVLKSQPFSSRTNFTPSPAPHCEQ